MRLISHVQLFQEHHTDGNISGQTLLRIPAQADVRIKTFAANYIVYKHCSWRKLFSQHKRKELNFT